MRERIKVPSEAKIAWGVAHTKARNAIIWIHDLETTEEKQGIEKLGGPKLGYCCLGRGCVVLDVPFRPRDGYSEEFRSRVGLLQANGGNGSSTCVSLSALNDTRRVPFKVIAQNIKLTLRDRFSPRVAELLEWYFHEQQKPALPASELPTDPFEGFER